MTDYADRAAAADAALHAPINFDDTAQVLPAGTGAKVVISTRVDPGHSAWIIAEAGKTTATPSALVAQLIAEAIAARQEAAGRPRRLVVDIEAAHRALDDLARPQAA